MKKLICVVDASANTKFQWPGNVDCVDGIIVLRDFGEVPEIAVEGILAQVCVD